MGATDKKRIWPTNLRVAAIVLVPGKETKIRLRRSGGKSMHPEWLNIHDIRAYAY